MILMENTHTNPGFVSFESKAQLFSGMHCWPTFVHAISIQGVVLDKPSDHDIKSGDIFRLNIALEGTRAIAMSIQVLEVTEREFKAKWTQIDMESFAILKRTIELNCHEKNRVREEIRELVDGYSMMGSKTSV